MIIAETGVLNILWVFQNIIPHFTNQWNFASVFSMYWKVHHNLCFTYNLSVSFNMKEIFAVPILYPSTISYFLLYQNIFVNPFDTISYRLDVSGIMSDKLEIYRKYIFHKLTHISFTCQVQMHLFNDSLESFWWTI